jgi:hypothetical protein
MCQVQSLIDDTIARGCKKQLSILIPTSELHETRSLAVLLLVLLVVLLVRLIRYNYMSGTIQ